jgi:protein RecA
MTDDKKKKPIVGKDFKSLINAVNNEFKSPVGTMAAEVVETADTPFKYSTNILSLDRYLGVGGLLGGRVMTCWGHEGTGKTLTALTVAAAVQRQKFDPSPGNPEGLGRVVFMDAEGTYSPEMAKAVGVDIDRLAVLRSTPERILTGEDYFDAMKIFIQNGVELIIVDSAPALVPSARMDATIGQGQKATHASMMAEGLQQITPLLNGHKRTTLWIINQIRMKPMAMFGPSSGPTGGEALKFFVTYSLEIKKKDDLVKKIPTQTGEFREAQIGVSVEATLHKNKTATIPVLPITFDIYFKTVTDSDGNKYTTGVDIYKDLIETAVSSGVVKQSSSWFYYKDMKGNGKADLVEQLRKAGPEMLQQIRNDVLGVKTPAPPVLVKKVGTLDVIK